MNRVLLTGRLTRDPELRTTAGGKAVAQFSVASHEYVGGKEKPEFHNVVTWDRLAETCAAESRRLHSLLRDQKLIAGIGRAWANEILHAAKLSPYALSKDVAPEEVERLAAAIDSELERGLALRGSGAKDERTYRVHRALGKPCHVCATPIAQVDFEEHTIYYCPQCQTGGRVLKDRRLSRLLR